MHRQFTRFNEIGQSVRYTIVNKATTPAMAKTTTTTTTIVVIKLFESIAILCEN